MVLPMRQQIVELGLQKAGERIDLANVIAFLMGVPWASLALAALLAGLIALTAGRIRRALPYIGSALGAAALVLICLGGLYLSAGVQQMIREASESLTILYRSAASGTLIRAGVLTAILLAGCVLCLAMSRRNGKTA